MSTAVPGRAARSSCACPAWPQQGTSRYPPPRGRSRSSPRSRACAAAGRRRRRRRSTAGRTGSPRRRSGSAPVTRLPPACAAGTRSSAHSRSRKLDATAVAAHDPAVTRVRLEHPRAGLRPAGRSPAAQADTHAGERARRTKGLGQVVARPRVEGRDLGRDAVLGGERDAGGGGCPAIAPARTAKPSRPGSFRSSTTRSQSRAPTRPPPRRRSPRRQSRTPQPGALD